MTSQLRPSARGGADPTAPRAQPGTGRAGTRPVRRCALGATAQRGAVTVELVGIIPLLVAVTLAMIGLIVVARDEVLAQGAAREGAREAALAADDARAAAAVRAALPPGRVARVAVAPAGPDRVRVSVSLETRLLFGVPPVDVRAEAVSLRESGPSPPAVGP